MWSGSDYSLSWRDTTPVRIHVLARSNSEADDNWYEHGVAHELVNMFLWNEAGRYENYNYFQRNPSWFPEGLSEYYVYNTQTVEDQFPPWGVKNLNETIKSGEGDFSSLTSKQYDGGHILAMYLIDRYGEDAVWGLLRNDASNWDDAVEEELGVTEAALERNFYRWAEKDIGGNYSDRIDSQNAEAEINELEAELEEKEEKIDELETELEDKESKIKQLKTEIDEPEAESGQRTDIKEHEEGESSVFIAAIAVVFGIFIALIVKNRLGDD